MDKIIINNLKIYAYHGVNPEEKQDGQNFILDIVCFADLSKPCMTDNVDDTVSYAKIIKLVTKVFLSKKCDLIEHAAQITAYAVLSEFPSVRKITITLKKPEAPMKADFGYTAVEITRENQL